MQKSTVLISEQFSIFSTVREVIMDEIMRDYHNGDIDKASAVMLVITALSEMETVSDSDNDILNDLLGLN